MKKLILQSLGLVLLSAGVAFGADKIPLKTEVPPLNLPGTPVPVPNLPNLEPEAKAWPNLMVPAGTVNLAKSKKVTSSDSDTIDPLDLVTDGDKAGDSGSWVELKPGKQWVQIDLEKSANIYAIAVWHFHAEFARVYRDVVVQVSDDPKFEKTVATVYDNSVNGKDRPYIETHFGKLMDTKGVKGRYVRLYSKGNTTNGRNHYIEVEVFGKPAA